MYDTNRQVWHNPFQYQRFVHVNQYFRHAALTSLCSISYSIQFTNSNAFYEWRKKWFEFGYFFLTMKSIVTLVAIKAKESICTQTMMKQKGFFFLSLNQWFSLIKKEFRIREQRIELEITSWKAVWKCSFKLSRECSRCRLYEQFEFMLLMLLLHVDAVAGGDAECAAKKFIWKEFDDWISTITSKQI